MKKKLLLIIVLTVVLGGCGWGSDFDETQWTLYENESPKFELYYPKDYKLITSNNKEYIQFLAPNSEQGVFKGLVIEYYNTEFYRPPAGTDVFEWVKKAGINQETSSKIEIDGNQAYNLQIKDKNGVVTNDYYYIIKDQQLYLVSLVFSDYNSQKDLYQKYLASIKID